MKVASVVEHSEGAAQKKLPGAGRDPMRLVKLLRGVEADGAAAHGDLEIVEIAYDSRKVKTGTLFVAIHGEKTDGNKFVPDALARGAAAIVSEQARPEAIPAEIPWIKVPDARKALACVAANYFGHPAEVLKLVGVTGTNGKTTTSYLVDSILRAAGCEVGLLGTIAYRLVRESRPAIHTTPESLDLQNFLAEVVRAGGTHAVLEASSHAGCSKAPAVRHLAWASSIVMMRTANSLPGSRHALCPTVLSPVRTLLRASRCFPFPASN